MDIALICSAVAGLMYLVGFGIYNKQMLRGESIPVITSWLIWAFSSVLDALTYLFSVKDFIKSLLPITGSAVCVLTFFFVLFKGKFTRINKNDWIIIIINIGALLVWWYFRNATFGNLILQPTIVLSFLPTFIAVWRNPRSEKWAPWIIWSLAYILMIITIWIRWPGTWTDLVYPINCLVMNATVAIFCLRRRPFVR